jgi:hypothetical protein
MQLIAVKKRLSLQHRRNGVAYVDYLIEDKDGLLKSVSPIQWTKIDLPDTTTDYNNRECYRILLKSFQDKISFGRFYEIVKKAESMGLDRKNAKDIYLFAITNK